MKTIFPDNLKKGDTIGFVTPAGPIKNHIALENAVKFFEKNGYNVELATHLKDSNGYLSSTDDFRADDLNKFFLDKEIKAIICVRGGYGCVRILDKINYDAIKNNPKIFVGCSDITALLSNINKETGLVTFHGPMTDGDWGAEEIDSFTFDNFFNFIEGDFSKIYEFKNNLKYKCIKTGITEGKLIGGNLCVLCSLFGTKFQSDFKDKILFIEDVNEPMYKIDRMLQQLKYAGIFGQIKGLLAAEFTGIEDTNGLEELISEITGEYNIPVGYGFSASHSRSKTTLPIGAKVEFDSKNGTLKTIR